MRAAPIFSDNMVLQCGSKVNIFGSCEPDCKAVTVRIPELNVSAEAVISSGKWKAVLPEMKPCNCCRVIISSENESIVFRNTAVGEVWIAGGQSNMEFELHSDINGEKELENCSEENVRFYYTPKIGTVGEELFEAENNTGWSLPSKEGARAWSAVGYYFAKQLSRALKVTVGIIGCNWGGTSASCWIPRKCIEEKPQLMPYLLDYEKAVAGKSQEDMKREYCEYLVYQAEWEKKMQKCYENDPDISWNEVQHICGENRYPGPMGVTNPMRPCGLFDTMVSRICPYTAKGVLWYQGESDDHRPQTYYDLMVSLIDCWRNIWQDENMFFLIVQLPMFKYKEDPDYKHWCLIREAQMKLYQTVKNTGLAVALDCGEFNNIHPVNKEPVGNRLFLQAMCEVYMAEDRKNCFPLSYKGYELNDDSITVFLGSPDPKHICTLRDLRSAAPEDMNEGFEVAGEDGVYFPADSVVYSEPANITLKSVNVKKPCRARFLWTNYADVKIWSSCGIPIPPFRTHCDETISAQSNGTVIRAADGDATGVSNS